jgi:hypothetical protein
MTAAHGNNNLFGSTRRRRNHKGALRRIVKRKRVASTVPTGGHIRGYTAILTLECGHVTDRQAGKTGKRAHCEVCIAAK